MAGDNRWPAFLRTVELFTNGSETQLNVLETERPVARRFFDWCAGEIPGYVPGSLECSTSHGTLRVGGRSFFQVNRFLVDDLVNTALADAAGGSAVDLYAGVGLFSIPLARRFSRVVAVESGGGAARDLEFNASRAGATLEARQASAEDYLDNLDQSPDFVLADPSRGGLGQQVVKSLLRLQPRSLTVVACDPATLARDVSALVRGGYLLRNATLVDLFPQTYHFETVLELTRAR
jgi:23S rRNA (uracil1939-C5)-methyltransferase